MTTAPSLRIVMTGCCGRMGRTIGALALQDPTVRIAAAVETAGHPELGHDYGAVLGGSAQLGVSVSSDANAAFQAGDVIVEFTLPEATAAHVELARALRKPMVIGTTGLTEAQRASLTSAARVIPIVFSPNMSAGVNLLVELAAEAVKRLGPGYDVEVIEAHHRGKKDAPSGTAKRLADALAVARGAGGAAVPVHSVRAGDIVGDHTVILAGPGERLELTHRAHSRAVFAQGALRAAKFVGTQPPGLYDMSHVLRGSTRS